LPFPYSALSSLLIIPAPIRDAVYNYIAKNRYNWFGKEDKCIVMKEKELLERFIDRDEMFGGGPGGIGSQFF
jgi:predicted DCC family thiol-disulfide oxidoreductase YuxK